MNITYHSIKSPEVPGRTIPYLGLHGKYRPKGFWRFAAPFWALVVAGLLNGIGYGVAAIQLTAARLANGGEPPPISRNLDRWGNDALVGVPILILFSLLVCRLYVRTMRVRSIHIWIGLVLFWAFSYIDGLFMFHLSKEPWNVPLAGLLLPLFAVSLATVTDEVLLPWYPKVGDRPSARARRSFAYFRKGTGRLVFDALRYGDAQMLAGARTEGPRHRFSLHMPVPLEHYTVVMLAFHPEDEAQNSYLTIKDVYFGNLSLRKRVFWTMGRLVLDRAELRPAERHVLAELVPGLIRDGSSAAPPIPATTTKEAAPPAWSSTTYVKSAAGSTLLGVEPDEVRALRARYSMCVALCWGLVFVLTYFEVGGALRRRFNDMSMKVAIWLFIFAVAAWGGRMAVEWIRYALAQRRNSELPGRDQCRTVFIEDCDTGEKDAAILYVAGGMLHVIFGRGKAVLAPADFLLSMERGSRVAPLRLDTVVGPRKWSFWLDNAEHRNALALPGGDPFARATALEKWLRDRIPVGGIGQ